MELAYTMYGGAPHLKKMQIGAAMATAGVPVVVGGTGNYGIALGDTTTGSVDLCGVTLDTQATAVTAQQTDNSDPERQVTVVINPDAVYRARLLGGAAAGTALAEYTVTTASTDGLDITTATAWNAPDFIDGVAWGYSGANAGIIRKITATDGTSATLGVALPFDSAVGDTFLRAGFAPTAEDQFVQLSTTLDEINASVATDTDNNNFRVIELVLRDQGGEGTTNSYAFIVAFDNLYAAGGSI